MSYIGVAEIPVDEDERPLPPPKPPVRNALLDGPILQARERLRSSGRATVLRYALLHWRYFDRFVDQPYLPVRFDLVEQADDVRVRETGENTYA